MGSIVASNVGKAFKRYPSSWARLREWLGFGPQHEDVWVLRDLSFSIGPGEAVGIIGRNGAGKSTLLKILTGTTQPSRGTVALQGRVAALLELGMGFNGEFTGRQNAYAAGLIAGMTTDEVTEQLPAIEAFAEIGSYMDEPVKHYSSGMQVRLAFSMATAVRPDILIIDEALAVGDAYFQHKCFERLKAFKAAGTTLLFVSHDPGAIKNLCERAILIDQGLISHDGQPDDAFDVYNAVIARQLANFERGKGAGGHTRSGDRRAEILSAHLARNGNQVATIATGDAAEIVVDLRINESIDDLTCGFSIRDRLGNEIFGTNSHYLQHRIVPLEPGQHHQIRFSFDRLFLGIGSYSLSISLHSRENHLSDNYDWWDRVCVFEVVKSSRLHPFVGSSFLPVSITSTVREGAIPDEAGTGPVQQGTSRHDAA